MSARTNPKSKPNITRFSYESTGFKGWRVSVTRHREVFTRYFSDRECGGMKKSQEAAQKCLAAFLPKLNAAPVVETKRKSSTGQTGVSEIIISKPRGVEDRVIWVASWPENNTRKVVKFPVAKYGARQAKQLAVKARKDAEQRLGLNLVRRFSKEEATRLKQFLAKL